MVNHFFIYKSNRDGKDYLYYSDVKDSEYFTNLKDIANFQKYKKNIELYTQLESFENWQESEDWGEE